MTGKPTGEQIRREARLQFVPLSRMKINPAAQRDMKAAWVDKLAAHFDLEEMGNPTVNHRDGWFNVIDGQHRIEALKIWLEDWEDQQVECWTYEGLTDEQEAEKFLKLQERLRTHAFDEFRIAVSAGRAEESEIDRIVRDLGLRVARAKNGIMATAALKKVYGRGGPELLARTLRIIRDSYGEGALDGPLIEGVGLFCQRYDGAITEERIIQKLTTATGGVGSLLQRSNVLRMQTASPRTTCIAAAVVDAINRRPGGRKLVPWWRADSDSRQLELADEA